MSTTTQTTLKAGDRIVSPSGLTSYVLQDEEIRAGVWKVIPCRWAGGGWGHSYQSLELNPASFLEIGWTLEAA